MQWSHSPGTLSNYCSLEGVVSDNMACDNLQMYTHHTICETTFHHWSRVWAFWCLLSFGRTFVIGQKQTCLIDTRVLDVPGAGRSALDFEPSKMDAEADGKHPLIFSGDGRNLLTARHARLHRPLTSAGSIKLLEKMVLRQTGFVMNWPIEAIETHLLNEWN